uniref:Uncharacterized protein n=1 Tax=Arundo donax TaxID=35708 RepID=A0A0A9EUN4_ARUDO
MLLYDSGRKLASCGRPANHSSGR